MRPFLFSLEALRILGKTIDAEERKAYLCLPPMAKVFFGYEGIEIEQRGLYNMHVVFISSFWYFGLVSKAILPERIGVNTLSL